MFASSVPDMPAVAKGDTIEVEIEGIGVLRNTVTV
jgi:hypothetical protein